MRFRPSSIWIVLYLGCLGLPTEAVSQNEPSTGAAQGDHDQVHFYVMPMIAIPSAELKKAINADAGWGISSGLLFNPFMKKKPSPVLLGIDFGYLFYGVDKIPENGNIPPIKTTYNVYTIGAAFRFLGNQDKKFTPFIDGVVGAKVFNTRTKVDYDLVGSAINYTLNGNSSGMLDSTNDTSLSYALGAGFFTRKPKPEDRGPRLSFTVRALYFWGQDAKYVVRNSVALDINNKVTYQTAYTKTDMFVIQLGIMIY